MASTLGSTNKNKIYKYYFIVNSYFLIFNNKHEVR